MKEFDYIKASNKAKISSSLLILREVMAMDGEYGVDPDKFASALNNLFEIEARLFNEIDVEGE